MKPEIKFNCYKRDGKLIIRNKSFFDAEVENMLEEKEYELILRKKKKQRSNNQNRYYWGVVVPIIYHELRELGFNEVKSIEDAHEILKCKFLKHTIVNDVGQFIESFKSTSSLSTSEFMDLIAEIQIWASEYLNLVIPDPNQELEIDF